MKPTMTIATHRAELESEDHQVASKTESRRVAKGTLTNRPGLHAQFAGRTSIGLVRSHNEDSLAAACLESGECFLLDQNNASQVAEPGMLFAICDGLGGHRAGEVASKLAVQTIIEQMWLRRPESGRAALASALECAIQKAHCYVRREANYEPDKRGMATTVTAAALVDDLLIIAGVGDSRAYLLRQGELHQLTRDHTMANLLIDAGYLPAERAKASRNSHVITQALGMDRDIEIDISELQLRQGDRVLLCSDGLSDMVSDDRMRRLLARGTDPAACANSLLRAALEGGGKDNCSILVADFDGAALVAPGLSDEVGYLPFRGGNEASATSPGPVQQSDTETAIQAAARSMKGRALRWLKKTSAAQTIDPLCDTQPLIR